MTPTSTATPLRSTTSSSSAAAVSFLPLADRRVPAASTSWAGMPGADPEYAGMYLHARYYDPKLGIFLSPDPIGPAGGTNLYGYAMGDPVNSVDRSGLDPDASCSQTTENRSGVSCPGTAVYVNATYPNPNVFVEILLRQIAAKQQALLAEIYRKQNEKTGNNPGNTGNNTGNTDAGNTEGGNTEGGNTEGGDKPRTLDCTAYIAATATVADTRAQGVEFGGFIYQREANAGYEYSAPFGGTPSSLPTFYSHRKTDVPGGASVVGWYHSQPRVPGYNSEVFSGGDLGASRYLRAPGFLITPSQQFLRLDPIGAGVTTRIDTKKVCK